MRNYKTWGFSKTKMQKNKTTKYGFTSMGYPSFTDDIRTATTLCTVLTDSLIKQV